MTRVLPQTTDKTNNPSHSFLHRVVSVDSGSPESSIDIDSAGAVTVGNGAMIITSVSGNASFRVRSGDNAADWSFTTNAGTGLFSVYNYVANKAPMNVSVTAPNSALNINTSFIDSILPFKSSNGSSSGTSYGLTSMTSAYVGQNFIVGGSGSVALQTYVTSTWYTRFYVNNAGNVGVGTTSPLTLFHLNGGYTGKVTETTIAYNILATDHTVVTNSSTNIGLALPVATVGQIFYIKNINSGRVTIDANGSDTIDGALTKEIGQWDAVIVQCVANSTWVILSELNNPMSASASVSPSTSISPSGSESGSRSPSASVSSSVSPSASVSPSPA